MTSLILRVLGGVAGLGSAVLFWFLGGTLSAPLRRGRLFSLDPASYELMAFLFIPALILAVVALFWVPPRLRDQGSLPEGRRLRQLLLVVFTAAFLIGIAK